MNSIVFKSVVFFIVIGLFNCASTGSVATTEPLVIDRAELKYPGEYTPGTKIIVKNTSINYSTRLGSRMGIRVLELGVNPVFVLEDDQFPLINRRIVPGRTYTVHHIVYNENPDVKRSRGIYYGNKFYLEDIEDLLSIEEAERIEASLNAAYIALRNPANHDLSKYRQITASDFSFEMTAGRLQTGSKVRFSASFLSRPTGISYKFREIDIGITLNSQHNFVSQLNDRYFSEIFIPGSPPFIIQRNNVTIYVTVIRAGQFGEVSIDAMNW